MRPPASARQIIDDHIPSLDEIFVARVRSRQPVTQWRAEPMRSPALAIAWQFWTRHRLGLSISAACLLLMVIAFPPILRKL